jgi:excisionase family DNA binding protein
MSIVSGGAQNYMNGWRQRSLRINGVDEYLTEAEVAELLKVSVGTVRRWRREGIGPPVLWAGGRPRYRRADVDAWLQRERGSE